MKTTKEQQDRDWEEMKIGMQQELQKAAVQGIRRRIKEGTLKYAELTAGQLELVWKGSTTK